MVDYLAKPRTHSVAILTAWEKLCKARRPPKVNLPALARRDAPFMNCWLAEEGWSFISSDFTSLEPSITASFCQDENYRHATFTGVGKEPYVHPGTGVLMIDDIYLMTGSVFPKIGDTILSYFLKAENRRQWVSDSEVCKKILKKERNLAKPACLGFSYGMGPKKFRNSAYDAGLDISPEDAAAMYKGYWEVFAGVRQLVKSLEVAMEKQGALTNPFGYRLTTEPHKAFNAMIQSSASGVMDILCLKFFQKLTDSKVAYKFVAVIHDEIIYQVEDCHLELTRQLQDEALTEINQMLGWDIPMRLGFVVAKTFGEIK